MSDSLTPSLFPILQNLRLLSGLKNISSNGLYFTVPTPSGTAPGGTNTYPIVISEESFPLLVKGSSVTNLGSALTNQTSPVTILTVSYTPAQKTSNIIIMAGVNSKATSGTSLNVDIQILIGTTLYTTSRTYQVSNTGSTSFFTSYIPGNTSATNFVLKAVTASGTSNIEIDNAYLSIMEI